MRVKGGTTWEKMMQDKRARYALLYGKMEHVVKEYVALYGEYERTRIELTAAINYMRQTGIAPDFLQRKGG
jgi:hypothetical protein